jgi:SAM-dependent methyltransferase
MNDSSLTIEERKQQELEIFTKCVNVHELPDIFHYWSNKYLRPILGEHDMDHPDDLYVKYMLEAAELCNVENPVFISIGSGNCDTEVRIAKRLKEEGLQQFCIECLDLNPTMLERGRELAVSENVCEHIEFIERDFNDWKANKEYIGVIANQSLHHIQNLEGVFAEVQSSLHENGSFITSDMIGRNGHLRWPEALAAVYKFWQELPEDYRYNHQLKRHESLYENWDCSSEGFEGIRAQDILPLLVQRFHFQLFIAFSNVIDVFIDRGFGHNFDDTKQWDLEFIDRVQAFDEASIQNGTIKPTHMMAVMKKYPVDQPTYSRGLVPQNCIREPDGFPIKISDHQKGRQNRLMSLINRLFSLNGGAH